MFHRRFLNDAQAVVENATTGFAAHGVGVHGGEAVWQEFLLEITVDCHVLQQSGFRNFFIIIAELVEIVNRAVAFRVTLAVSIDVRLLVNSVLGRQKFDGLLFRVGKVGLGLK